MTCIDDRFHLLRAYLDGHRYYLDRKTRRIAVADQSVLDNPSSADMGPCHAADGVLYLDWSRKLVFTGSGFSAPLIDDDLTPTSTPVSQMEADWLNRTFNWPIDVR